MPCNKPQRALRTPDKVTFVGGNTLFNMWLPCRQCAGCRLHSSSIWATRCWHESKLHTFNSYITLTLDDAHLTSRYWTGLYRPDGRKAYAGTLHLPEIVAFNKRLLKAINRQKYDGLILGDTYRKNSPPTSLPVGRRGIPTSKSTPQGTSVAPQKAVARRMLRTFRFYLAGEYGEQYRRPHWHSLLFGVQFADLRYKTTTEGGHKLYESPTLQKLWPYGHSTVGELTWESSAYVARYVMKKINGKKQEEHYTVIDQDTGEIIRLRPELNNMSRAGGIGLGFFNKFYTDMYPEGKMVVRGHETNTPRYYDKKFKQRDPIAWENLELDRLLANRDHWQDNTAARLRAREAITLAKTAMLKRGLKT